MSESGPLINLGDISKPATVLIERISDAMGAVFQPYQIKRIAKAEAEAAKIRALARIKVSKIQRRALVRMIQEEGKKQENIEKIASLAIPDLRPDAKPENLQNDWLAHFFDKCRLVSDAEMQTLWGKLLAGETNQPGTFSRRTVELVSALDKGDAQLFTNLCRFAWHIRGVAPLVYDVEYELYNRERINFGSLTHLDDIGLITFDNLNSFAKKGFPKRAIVSYYDRPASIEFQGESNNDLNIGRVLLTKVGHELAPICGSTEAEGFYSYVFSEWRKHGYIVSESPPDKPGEGGVS